MLEVRDLQAYYGKSYIIQGISLKVAKGEVVSILGRNGVGKTTLLRSILGLTPPRRTGSVKIDNIETSSLPAHKIAELEVGYVPQGRRIFPRLTVLENLSVPVIKGKADEALFEEIFGYFPALKERTKQLGGTLSGGEQQMLAIGRALMTHPKLVVFDEPTEGLQPSLVFLVRDTVKSLRERGIAVLIADQNLENALSICDSAYVLEKGTIKYKEKRENLSLDLLRRYLGVAVKFGTKE